MLGAVLAAEFSKGSLKQLYRFIDDQEFAEEIQHS